MAKLDKYAHLTFDFIDTVRNEDDLDGVRRMIIRQLEQFGFEYTTIWTLPQPGQDPIDGILLNTRPIKYVEHYIAENYVEKDPVILELNRAIRPFSWSDVRARGNLPQEQLSIIDEARDFQIHDGLIVPIVTDGASLSIVSPCGLAPDLSMRARSAVELIAISGHQALKRAIMIAGEQEPRSQILTKREREVLKWIAIGKTDGEIGDILSISTTTVHSHVEAAKRKLGCYKRVVAVVQALMNGEISL